MFVAEPDVSGSELRDFLENLGGLPSTLVICALIGGGVGYAVFAALPGAPGGWGLVGGGLLGVIVAVSVWHVTAPPSSAHMCEDSPAVCQPVFTPAPGPLGDQP